MPRERKLSYDGPGTPATRKAASRAAARASGRRPVELMLDEPTIAALDALAAAAGATRSDMVIRLVAASRRSPAK
jgi:hypothetical protein